MNDSGTPVSDRLWDRFDKDGSIRQANHFSEIATSNRFVRAGVRLLGIDREKFDELHLLSRAASSHVSDMARIVTTFSPWGWAPSGLVPTAPYVAALEALAGGADQRAVEEILVHGWRDSMLRWLHHRVGNMGSSDAEYHALFQRRSELVRLAWKDHTAGRFHAAVPIVAAQVEGISFDVAQRAFFSKRNGVVPVDDASLAGLHEALPVARDWFSLDVSTTTMHDDGSRHGILHGRSLGYDTEVISTKYFVLLAAVWEWAKPLADAEGQRRRSGRERANAGSSDVDAIGRRLDDREFEATREALDHLFFAQIGWGDQGAFRADLAELLSDTYGFRDLPTKHGVVLTIAEDRRTWWAWRRTVSGWILGVAGDRDHNRWFWSESHAPTAPPPTDGWVATNASTLRRTGGSAVSTVKRASTMLLEGIERRRCLASDRIGVFALKLGGAGW